MARPGVMFYFDIRPCIRRLSLQDKGQLFEAILDYAENGFEPELDGALGVAWDFIQPRIDRDSAQYEQKTEKNRYATFTRELKKQGHDAISFDDWKALTDIERHRMMSDDDLETSDGTERYPTTTSTSTSTSTSTIPSRPSAKPSRLSGEDFEVFWKAYPRKESKAQAKKSFAKVTVPLETLLQALETQKQSDQWSRNDGRYIPYASTWLNQRRWEDEAPAQIAGSAEPVEDWQREHPEWLDQSTWVCDVDGMYKPREACKGACV